MFTLNSMFCIKTKLENRIYEFIYLNPNLNPRLDLQIFAINR